MAWDKSARRALGVGLLFSLGSATSAGALVEPTIIDDGSGDARVVPISNTVAMVEPGESEWVAINWTSLDADARELKVTAVGSEGVAVDYPEHPVDGYSSGYSNDTLTQSEIDYTALKLTVKDDMDGPHALTVTVSYVSDTGDQSETFVMPLNDNGDDGDDNVVPTTAVPTTAPPTTAVPTTAVPTTAVPTTAVPTTAVPTTAVPTTAVEAELPAIISFAIVNTETDTQIGPLVDGDVISRSELGRQLSIEAIANDVTESVRFQVDGRNHRVEQYVPYAIQGDIEGDFAPWRVGPGTYTLKAIPFGEDYAEGVEGLSKTITITITN